MFAFLFDEDGSRRDAHSRELRRSLDAADAGYDFRRFMIVNAGWVEVAATQAELSVALRPAKVNPKALAGAMFTLADLPDTPSILEVHDGTRKDRYAFPSKEGLSAAICRVVTEADDARLDRFRRRSAGRDAGRHAPKIVELVNAWRELDGVLDMERMWRLLNHGFAGRYIIVAPSRDGFLLESMGEGFAELAGYWRGKHGRTRITDQPDPRYGRWVANAYQDAHNRAAPLVEKVDCEIEWPREGVRRHRYWRVIAPFQRPGGADALIGVTLPDNAISLRG